MTSFHISPELDIASGLLGGAMIGLAAGILLTWNGDILGCSGILNAVALHPWKALRDPATYWKLVFITSFVVTTRLVYGTSSSSSELLQLEAASGRTVSSTGMMLAGAAVGFGTRLGNGCTSGHGICGLARFSPRSFVAVLTFMATGMVTSYLTSPTSPLAAATAFLRDESTSSSGGITGTSDSNISNMSREVALSTVATALLTLATLIAPWFQKTAESSSSSTTTDGSSSRHYHHQKVAAAAVTGGLFAMGLKISGMVSPAKVQGFLNLSLLSSSSGWDPQLMFVMGGGLIVSMISYEFLPGYGFSNASSPQKLIRPVALRLKASPNKEEGSNGASSSSTATEATLLQKTSASTTSHTTATTPLPSFSVPTSTILDLPLVMGATFFGIGWGMAGMCPGPALFGAVVGMPLVGSIFLPSFFVGAYTAEQIQQHRTRS